MTVQRLQAAQRVLMHAVRAEGDDAIIAAQSARYAELGVDGRDGEQLAGSDLRRIRVYRRLVRGGLIEAIEAQLDRTVARMGRSAYESWFDRYCREALPRSQILRDVAYDFAAWAAPLWRADAALPAYLADFARHELLEFDVMTGVRSAPSTVADELVADRPVAFDGTVRVGRFDHVVHAAAEDPVKRPHGVLGYRDSEGTYRQMELTPLATAIMGRLAIEGEAFAPAVQAACADEGIAVDQAVIDGTSQLLADLADRGMVLGALGFPELGSRESRPEPSPYFRWLYSESLGQKHAPSMLQSRSRS